MSERVAWGITAKAIDRERREVDATLSDRGRDRMREEVASWKDLPRDFPILWQHDHSRPAIGRGRKPQVRPDGSLHARLSFPPPGVHRDADLVFELLALGILTDVSVGFLSPHPEMMSDGHLRHLDCELLEASVVNVGANPRAQVMARALGLPLSDGLGADGADTEAIIDLDDEITGVSAADVLAAVRLIVPQLANAEVVRLQGRILNPETDVDGIEADEFNPLTSAHDRAELVAAFKIAVPALLRRELTRLRGAIDDEP